MRENVPSEPSVDLDVSIRSDNHIMSNAKKIDEHDLPPPPTEERLRLVVSAMPDALPPPPEFNSQTVQNKRKWILIIGAMSFLFLMVAGSAAATLYLIVDGTIDIQPSEIKRFLKALSFK